MVRNYQHLARDSKIILYHLSQTPVFGCLLKSARTWQANVDLRQWFKSCALGRNKNRVSSGLVSSKHVITNGHPKMEPWKMYLLKNTDYSYCVYLCYIYIYFQGSYTNHHQMIHSCDSLGWFQSKERSSFKKLWERFKKWWKILLDDDKPYY